MLRLRAIDPRTKSRDGFTLLEVLVSMSVLALLVALLIQIFGATTTVWQTAEGRNSRNRVGRTVTDFIGQELRGAMLPVGNVAAKGNPNLQFLINPPRLNVPDEYRNPHSIFWQAPIATEQSQGDVAAVGYFVKWEQNGAVALPSLRRFFVNPTTVNPETGVLTANPDFLIYRDEQNWLNADLIERVAKADKASGYAGLFAENVVGLWVRFYGADGREIAVSAESTEVATAFDSRRGYEYLDRRGGASGEPRKVVRYLPLQVAVSIAQVDPAYTARLATAWQKVRALANRPEGRDAAQFLANYQAAAVNDAELRSMLPGVRIQETHVILENAR